MFELYEIGGSYEDPLQSKSKYFPRLLFGRVSDLSLSPGSSPLFSVLSISAYLSNNVISINSDLT